MKRDDISSAKQKSSVDKEKRRSCTSGALLLKRKKNEPLDTFPVVVVKLSLMVVSNDMYSYCGHCSHAQDMGD